MHALKFPSFHWFVLWGTSLLVLFRSSRYQEFREGIGECVESKGRKVSPGSAFLKSTR